MKDKKLVVDYPPFKAELNIVENAIVQIDLSCIVNERTIAPDKDDWTQVVDNGDGTYTIRQHMSLPLRMYNPLFGKLVCEGTEWFFELSE